MAILTTEFEGTEAIFIIGKGSSIDKLNLTVLDSPSSLVINMNDSERIYAGLIGVFNDEWVLDSLKETGGLCTYYVVPELLSEANYLGKILSPSQIDDNSHVEYHMGLQILEEAGAQKSAVVGAIDVSYLISRSLDFSPSVYCLGFDFGSSFGLSVKMARDFSDSNEEFRRAFFGREEETFRQIHSWSLANSKFNLIHVGNKEYSDVGPDEFNKLSFTQDYGVSGSVTTVNESREKKTNQQRVLIVAELTTNHFGNLSRLEDMVIRAKAAGVDYVKVQKRNVESFYSKTILEEDYESPFGKTFRDYRNAIELDADGFRFLDDLCRNVGIDWFCSVLDRVSFEFIQQFKPSMIKIPSTISNHRSFIEHVAHNYFGDVVVSTGYSDEEYESYVLDLFGNCNKLYLLQCVSSYPSRETDANIAIVRKYWKLSSVHKNVVPGYSSHDIGTTCSMLAVAAGARMIEKHATIGENVFSHFDHVALRLDRPEFQEFVEDIRRAESITGSEIKRVLNSEHHKYWIAETHA